MNPSSRPTARAASPVTALLLAAAGALSLSPTAQATGTAEVRFVEPEHYTDIGRTAGDRQRHLGLIERHVQALARRLPDGQHLRLEVLDVDLAGEERWVGSYPDLRVLRGRADWPRMQVRYTLSAGGQTLRSGEERLQDMAYLDRAADLPRGEPLAYDLRLLDEWFAARVLGPAPRREPVSPRQP